MNVFISSSVRLGRVYQRTADGHQWQYALFEAQSATCLVDGKQLQTSVYVAF